MTFYLALLLAACGLTLGLTPLIASTSRAFGLVDAPGGRKVHSVSVPRVGGLSVYLAAALVLAAGIQLRRSFDGNSPDFQPLLPVLLGATLVFIVGLADDVRSLSATSKLVVELIAAALVMSSGLLIERLTLGGSTWQLGYLAYPLTLAWIVGLTNAFNLIDGIDGLASGVAVIAGTTCAIILIGRGHDAEAMVLAALVGAALGFLAFNFAPASIFLGDGGSLLFGFVLATTAVTGWQKGATALAAGVPLLIFALPLADAAFALVRRAGRRPPNGESSLSGVLRRIAAPDRQHIHHRLIALGWSTRAIVLALYAITLVLSVVALGTARFD